MKSKFFTFTIIILISAYKFIIIFVSTGIVHQQTGKVDILNTTFGGTLNY